MAIHRLISIQFVIILFITACSPQYYLDKQAKAVLNLDATSKDLYENCDDYREMIYSDLTPDTQAMEKCIDYFSPKNSTGVLNFCKILSDSGAEISPTVYDECLQAAKSRAMATTDYEKGRDQFLGLVQEYLPFVSEEDARPYAEEIYRMRFIQDGQILLSKILNENQNCKSVSDSNVEFWDLVAKENLGDSFTEDIKSTVKSMVILVNSKLEEKNFLCAGKTLENLGTFIKTSPFEDILTTDIDISLPNWIDIENKLESEKNFIDALVLINGIQVLPLKSETENRIGLIESNLIQKNLENKEGTQSIQDKVSFLCPPQKNYEDILYGEVYNELLFREHSTQGKLINCSSTKIPEVFLPNSLDEAQYLFEEEKVGGSTKLLRSCEYSGGYTLDWYTSDYRLKVKNIITGKTLAETTINSKMEVNCDLFWTFHSKRDGYDVPPSEEEVSNWLSGLIFD